MVRVIEQQNTLLEAADGLIYGDLFGCALTLQEMIRFSRCVCTEQDMRECMDFLERAGLVFHEAGYYALAGRRTLIGQRVEAQARSRALIEASSLWTRAIQYLPFVRGLAITGSVAAEDADRDADLDLLVVVASGRLSTVFTILGSFSTLTGRRYFCPNFYISETHLAIERQNHYVAREILQAIGLTGQGRDLLRHNSWVGELFPNATPRTLEQGKPFLARALQRLLEWPLSGWLGDRMEEGLSRLAAHRLRSHYGEIPAKVWEKFEDQAELRFHNAPRMRGILELYRQGRDRFAQSLKVSTSFEAVDSSPSEMKSSLS